MSLLRSFFILSMVSTGYGCSAASSGLSAASTAAVLDESGDSLVQLLNSITPAQAAAADEVLGSTGLHSFYDSLVADTAGVEVRIDGFSLKSSASSIDWAKLEANYPSVGSLTSEAASSGPLTRQDLDEALQALQSSAASDPKLGLVDNESLMIRNHIHNLKMQLNDINRALVLGRPISAFSKARTATAYMDGLNSNLKLASPAQRREIERLSTAYINTIGAVYAANTPSDP